MFKIQHKDGPRAKWKDLQFGGSYPTEAEAWAQVARFDQDGYIDRHQYRVVRR